jgi:hypothetical protein
MPISIEEYATPSWIKMRDRYPWVLDRNYRYRESTVFAQHNVDRYARDTGGRYAWKQPGYNPNDDTVRTETVNLGTDTTERTYRPY